MGFASTPAMDGNECGAGRCASIWPSLPSPHLEKLVSHPYPCTNGHAYRDCHGNQHTHPNPNKYTYFDLHINRHTHPDPDFKYV